MSPIPTPEHLTAFLTGRGWLPPPEGGVSGYWLGPDGEHTFLWEPHNERTYQRVLDAIAATEGRSPLNIGLELEGRPRTETDLSEVDHAIAVWALLRRYPQALKKYTEQPSTMPSLAAIPADERGPLLNDLREHLDQVATLLGTPHRADPPVVLAPADARPRTAVWAERLAPQDWFLRWPVEIRDRIVAAIVRQEATALELRLVQQHFEDRDTTPEWQWDSATSTVRLRSGSLDRPPPPRLDALLADIQQRIEPRLFEVAVVAHWLRALATDATQPGLRDDARALLQRVAPDESALPPLDENTGAAAAQFAHLHAADPAAAAFPANVAPLVDTGTAMPDDPQPRPEPERSP